MGAIVSSTDAAAVFSVLRRIRLRPADLGHPRGRVRHQRRAGRGHRLARRLRRMGPSTVVAARAAARRRAVGRTRRSACSWAGSRGALLARIALPAVGLYPLAVLAFIVVAYSSATLLHVSGFLAVYVCALIIGSSRLPHRRAVLGFAEGLAWLAQIGLFVAARPAGAARSACGAAVSRHSRSARCCSSSHDRWRWL